MDYKEKWLNKMIEITDRVIYHNMATNCSSYISTFIDAFKGLKKFTIREDFKINYETNQKDIDIIAVNEEQKDIINIGSDSKFNQFCDTLIAFGFIKAVPGYWEILTTDINMDEITKTLFTKHYSENINIIRQSRMIGLLISLDIITKENYKDFNLKGKKSQKPVFDAIKFQISLWEKGISESVEKSERILKLITSYQFIKKY
ncbi:hypothetical protein MFERI14815_00179 [Mycoplasma feriruminatoris]|uniref:DUF262 domain-containing protein n=1 Tax=Mycoplasma feriruminatoris TaxID=1179777 RepID=UPI00241E50BF|nr:DUF262 domain-containing protein [Mycoplasma feriruminatoris]WFQ91583.1 hypothetical protein MFERI14815_00179 [Mycoplasma feriruminatoris]